MVTTRLHPADVVPHDEQDVRLLAIRRLRCSRFRRLLRSKRRASDHGDDRRPCCSRQSEFNHADRPLKKPQDTPPITTRGTAIGRRKLRTRQIRRGDELLRKEWSAPEERGVAARKFSLTVRFVGQAYHGNNLSWRTCTGNSYSPSAVVRRAARWGLGSALRQPECLTTSLPLSPSRLHRPGRHGYATNGYSASPAWSDQSLANFAARGSRRTNVRSANVTTNREGFAKENGESPRHR